MMQGVVSVVFIVFCLLSLASAEKLTWSRIEYNGDEAPSARSGTHMAYDQFNDCIYVWSGSSDQQMWKFDMITKAWTVVQDGNDTIAAPVPAARKFAYYGLVRFGGESGVSLFVLSHGFLDETEFGDTWVFNTETNQWSEVNTTGPRPSERYGGHFGVYNGTGEFWMGGGFSKYTLLPTRYIDTYTLRFSNITEATWTRVHDQPSIGNQFDPLVPHGRCLHASAVVEEEKIVIWGGCMRGGTGGGPCPADDSWYFDNNDGEKIWTQLPACATPRVWSAMAPLTNTPGKALFYGGSTEWIEQIISAEEWPEEEVLVVDVNDESWTRYTTLSNNGEYPLRRFDHAMSAGKNGTVYMFGGRLLSNVTSLNDLWVITGDPADTDTLDCATGWVSIPHVHGILMVLAFGILFPTGFFVARFFKCKGPGKASKVWFICHVIIQVTAIIITIPAFTIIFYAGASLEPTHPHAIIGIILMFLMIIQPINGIFRPRIKEGKEKTCYRIFWEWFHRIYGISIILIGLTQVTLGVFLIVPPRPVWIVWILALFAWVISFTVLEIVRCLIIICSEPSLNTSEDVEMKNRPERKLSTFNN